MLGYWNIFKVKKGGRREGEQREYECLTSYLQEEDKVLEVAVLQKESHCP